MSDMRIATLRLIRGADTASLAEGGGSGRPGGRVRVLAEPKEIAEIVVFLASPRSSDTTGATAVIG